MKIDIYFDGACNNALEKPHMGIGLAVFINNEYQENLSNFIHHESNLGIRGTSNIAEWIGCMEAMRKANSLKLIYPDSDINVFSDSQIVAFQFNGKYEVRKGEFKKYYVQAKRFADRIGIIKITWIKRELNKKADKLSKQGLHQNDQAA